MSYIDLTKSTPKNSVQSQYFDKFSIDEQTNSELYLTSGWVQIHADTSFTHACLQVITVEGVLILKKEAINGNSFTVDLSQETKGVYLLQLVQQDMVANFKLIKFN